MRGRRGHGGEGAWLQTRGVAKREGAWPPRWGRGQGGGGGLMLFYSAAIIGGTAAGLCKVYITLLV